MFSSRALLAGLIGAVGASGGLVPAPTYAQSSPPAATTSDTTITTSKVDQFLLTPEGTVSRPTAGGEWLGHGQSIRQEHRS
jgi:hypothetical protein